VVDSIQLVLGRRGYPASPCGAVRAPWLPPQSLAGELAPLDQGQLHRARPDRYAIHATRADDLDEGLPVAEEPQVPLAGSAIRTEVARWIACHWARCHRS
jgi:hypothetical protein